MDGIWLKQSWGGSVENVSILIAIGVNEEGYREIIGVREGRKEDAQSWKHLLRNLQERGLEQIRLIVSDKSKGLIESIPDFYPKAAWQRCVFHFHQNILHEVPRAKRKEVAAMLKAIHAMESEESSYEKSEQIVSRLKAMKLPKAAKVLSHGISETLSYYQFPREHHRSLRTNNMLERIVREIRRRTRVVGSFPDGESALMLVSARLRHIESKAWSERRVYLDMSKLRDQDQKREVAKQEQVV